LLVEIRIAIQGDSSHCFPVHMCYTLNWLHIKVRAHKKGMRIGKKPKKQESIWCPQCKGTNAETLKQQRPIGEGDQEQEKRLVREESILLINNFCMNSHLNLKQS
jgi:hypothetical protein